MAGGSAAVPAGSVREEWRRGGPTVAASFTGMMLSSAVVTSVGVYMTPLQAEFGWPRAAIASAVAIVTFFGALSAPLVGLLIERVGLRKLGIVGCIATPAAFALIAASGGSIYQFWLTYALIAMAHAIASPLIWVTGVSRIFSRARGTALAVVLMGSSAMGALHPMLATLGLSAIGWRLTILATALVLLLLTLSMTLAFFRPPEEMSTPAGRAEAPAVPKLKLGELLQSWLFVRVLLATFLGCMTMLSLVIHCIPLLIGRGYTPFEASTGMSVVAGTSLVVKIGIGYFVDRTNIARLSAGLMALTAVPVILLQVAVPGEIWWLVVIGASLGVASSAELDILANIVAKYFGMANFTEVYSFVFGAFQLALGVGPILLGLTYDITRSYDFGLKVMLGLIAVSSLLFLTLGPPRAEDTAH